MIRGAKKEKEKERERKRERSTSRAVLRPIKSIIWVTKAISCRSVGRSGECRHNHSALRLEEHVRDRVEVGRKL